MKIKSKIVLSVCVFALVFSLLSISSFASVPEFVAGERYIVSESILLPSDSFSVPAFFIIDGITFSSVFVQSDFIIFHDTDYEIGFSPSLGWVDSTGHSVDVEFVIFLQGDFSSLTPEEYSLFLSYFDVFAPSDPDSFYNQIFNSIAGAVFGEYSLTPEQNLSLSLISTVLSIGMVLLPVLLAIGFVLRCFRL